MNHTSTEHSNIQGELSIFIKPQGYDEAILFFREKNRITNKARKHLLALAIGDTGHPNQSPNPIVSFRVGEGGVGQVPTGAETTLYDMLDPEDLIYPYLTGVTWTFADAPNDMIAQYAFEIPDSALDGKTISEVGLFCENNWDGTAATNDHMFNIKVFPPVTKTTSFALVFVWRINFSGAC